MPNEKRKDHVTQRIEQVLKNALPQGKVEAYRPEGYQYVIRVRVIDDGFRGMSRLDRYDLVERHLAELSEADRQDITMLVLLAPEETEHSLANLEFDDPAL